MKNELIDYDVLSVATKSVDIFPLIQGITELFRFQKYDEVDGILKTVEVEKLSKLSRIAVIRFSYSARYNLSEWYDTRDRFYKYVVETEGIEEAEQQFKGLM